MRDGEELAFRALATPTHRAVIADVASACGAGRSFADLLRLGSHQPALSQQLAKLTAARLLIADRRGRGAVYQLAPALPPLNRWFAALDLAEELLEARPDRAAIQLQPLFESLSRPLCRRIAGALRGRSLATGTQLSYKLDIDAPSRSRATSRMVQAGLLTATYAHPHKQYALRHDAFWRAWDWIYDLHPDF